MLRQQTARGLPSGRLVPLPSILAPALATNHAILRDSLHPFSPRNHPRLLKSHSFPNTNRCDKVCPGTTIGAFAGTFGLGVIASGGYYLRKKNLAKAPQRQYLKGLEEALESAGHHL
ncbi:hypothetical protein FRB94_000807 [Tulasnella sp. JGI-2019a]|nr:hypothetical protein FRB94_000807 [Tulasnella sp. JGI-2019a]